MKNWKEHAWYLPALYVAFMFGEKLLDGLAHSREFMDIISVVAPLAPYAYTLALCVGILDVTIGLLLLLNPLTFKSALLQRLLFVWTFLWPFVPATLRIMGHVGEFETLEVLSISFASALSFYLWNRFAPLAQAKTAQPDAANV